MKTFICWPFRGNRRGYRRLRQTSGYSRLRRAPSSKTHRRNVSTTSDLTVQSSDEDDNVDEQAHRMLDSSRTDLETGNEGPWQRKQDMPDANAQSRIIRHAPALRDCFTKQTSLNMLIYAILSLHNTTMDQLFPMVCSTSVKDGGLAMSAKQVGTILSIAGALAVVLQILIFAPICNIFGTIKCFRAASLLYR